MKGKGTSGVPALVFLLGTLAWCSISFADAPSARASETTQTAHSVAWVEQTSGTIGEGLVLLRGRGDWQKALVSDDFREDLNTTWSERTDLSRAPMRRRNERLSAAPRTYMTTKELAAGVIGKQPTGCLSGKIVYLSGGHGWTCDITSSSMWYTQRPLTFGIVEDFGNLDQANMFADFCWRAGATIVPLRPLGNQPVERVVDNTSPQARFEGRWYTSKSPIYFGKWYDAAPYYFAIASKEETAVARYQPFIPVSDYYPVYCWARDGADRVTQTYRIRHAGGVTEVQVNHRRVGKGWIYLGEYYFNRGSDGFVEVTNEVSDPADADGKHVVIADAIRFGNGLGDTNRGGGISGHPREEEAARYWAERALPIGAPPQYDVMDSSDQDNNVGTPPRTTAYMNRESEGTFFDRIYLGFHSNAVGGRGVVGLFGKDADKRPDHQVEFAELVAKQLNEDLTTTGAIALPVPWNVRKKLTDSHINFGEIRRDAINNEMCATIVEVAFHDNPLDAILLRDPQFRQFVARSMLKAITRFLYAHSGNSSQPVFPPEPPRLISAVALTTSSVALQWLPPAENPVGGDAPEAYRVYYSRDGFSLDGGRIVGLTTGTVITDLPTTGPHYFRIAAVNRGGESAPSRLLGAYCSTEAPTRERVLVVSAFTTFSEDVALTQSEPLGLGSPLHAGGDFVRLIPRKMNAGNYVSHWGNALAANNVSFDSIASEILTSMTISPTNYGAVLLQFGRQSVRDGVLSSQTRRWCETFAALKGKLIVSGSNVVEELDDATTRPTATDRAFARNFLRSRFVRGDLGATVPLVAEKRALRTTSPLMLDIGSGDAYRAVGNDAFALVGEGRPLLRYGSESGQLAAALVSPKAGKGGKVIVMGFPLEAIHPPAIRASLLGEMLETLGVGRPPSTKGKESQASATKQRSSQRVRR